jgi:hypothetical protein
MNPNTSYLNRLLSAMLAATCPEIVQAAAVADGVHYGASEAYVMVLVGLGLLGFIVSRRK